MSLTHDEVTHLMAYVDGEIDDAAIGETEALLAGTDEKSDEARRLVAELGAVGDWVRTASEGAADAAGTDAIADSVMAEIAKGGDATVVPFDPAARASAQKAGRKRVTQLGVFAALAVAAMVALWAWPQGRVLVPGLAPGPIAQGPEIVLPPTEPLTPSPPASGPTPAPAESSLAVQSAEGVDVENVEAPHQVSVFYLPVTNKNAASVVVWIGDDQEVH